MGNSSSKSKPNTEQSFHYSSTKLMQYLISLEKIIFDLTEENIIESVGATMKLLNNDDTSPYSNLILSRIIYSSILSQMKDLNLYIDFIKQIEIKEKELNKNENELFNRFKDFLLDINSQESYFILEKMIEMNLISSNSVKNKNFYFAHHFANEQPNILQYLYNSYKYHNESYEELKINDFELHKKYVKEGVNPNEISKIIRNDEIEKLQEISSQSDFDFKQTIKPSLYERCSFINNYASLIDYAAFFGSIECFKYLLLNGANVSKTGKYAVAGGNEEIIHLCEQNHSSFEDAYEAAIQFHRNDVFHYLYDNKVLEIKNSVTKLIELFLTNKFMNYEIP